MDPLLGHPDFKQKSFKCSACGVMAQQYWSEMHYWDEQLQDYQTMAEWHISECHHCDAFTIWHDGRRVYPVNASAVQPNQDLPDEIRKDFDEAGQIAELSPRGAAALLRLCIQKMCIHLGLRGNNINADIGDLVGRGLDPRIQKALDVVRVTGNNAVHPGKISFDDGPAEVDSMFKLVNWIAEDLITRPKHIDDKYNALPPTVRETIDERDRRARQKSSDADE